MICEDAEDAEHIQIQGLLVKMYTFLFCTWSPVCLSRITKAMIYPKMDIHVLFNYNRDLSIY